LNSFTKDFDMLSKTEVDITTQAAILARALADMDKMRPQITEFFRSSKSKRVVFTGSGSSYCLSQSGALMLRHYAGFNTEAIAAGDLMLNFDVYANSLEDAILVLPSRSGQTSEVIRAIDMIKKRGINCRIFSICGLGDTPLAKLSDLALELPYLAEEAVCQTRAVTVFFILFGALAAIAGGKDDMYAELRQMLPEFEKYIPVTGNAIKEFLQNKTFTSGVILADAELGGLADEGAMAIKEICLLPSNYYHLLDVRHGPIVTINQGTICFLISHKLAPGLLNPLIADLKHRGATVVALQGKNGELSGQDLSIIVPDCKYAASLGMFLITAIQFASLYMALATGIDPDTPPDLKPWIKLDDK